MSEHETHRANSQSEEFHYSMLKCVQVFRKRPHVHHFVERGEVRLESVHGPTINFGSQRARQRGLTLSEERR